MNFSKLLFAISFLGLLNTEVCAQTHEFNFGLGGASYYGDLNAAAGANSAFEFMTNPDFKNQHLSYGLGYRFNFPSYVSLGLNYTHTNLSASDFDREDVSNTDPNFNLKARNLSFFTSINQYVVNMYIEPFRNRENLSLGELPEIEKWRFSPYVGVGIGFVNFNPKTIDDNGNEVELQPVGTEGQGLPNYDGKYKTSTTVIPTYLGMRFVAPSNKFSINLELSYVYTLSDYLDDVSGVYASDNDFTSNYPPVQASEVMALADRNLYGQSDANSSITAGGQQRGSHVGYDNYFIPQIKFSYYLKTYPGRDKFASCY